MSLENLITTILSVDYMFGATTALACNKAVRGLITNVIGGASNRADTRASDSTNDSDNADSGNS